MGVAVVTGSAGLIGAETVRYFADKGFKIFGIDNDMRKYFFGEEASTEWSRINLEETIPHYNHINADIRNTEEIKRIFSEIGKQVDVVIHTAAQPSHDCVPGSLHATAKKAQAQDTARRDTSRTSR